MQKNRAKMDLVNHLHKLTEQNTESYEDNLEKELKGRTSWPYRSEALQEPEQDEFLFDEYVESVETIDFAFPNKPVPVPITIRTSIDIGTRQAHTKDSIKIDIDPNTRAVKVKSIDQDAYTNAVLLSAVVRWPFKNKDGNPTPINASTIKRLPQAVADEIVARALGVWEAQVNQTNPFAQPSETA